LLEEGYLDHNGKLRTAARYRKRDEGAADTGLGHPAEEVPPPPRVDTPEEAAAKVRDQDAPSRLARVGASITNPSLAGGIAGIRQHVERTAPAALTGTIPGPEVDAPAAPVVALPVSGRVRRQLEREAREREQREALASAEATLLDAQPGEPGTALGKALESLRYRPATIPELASRLKLEPREAAALIRKLEDDEDLNRVGRRGGEIVYEGRR
jgi:hypothetical protein